MNAVQVEMAEQEATFAAPAGALREQAAARLAAHRERRTRVAARQAEAVAVPAGLHAVPFGGSRAGTPSGARSERIAAAVAERYAQTQSYRAFLAAEAESSVRLAQAAAEVAARNAEAIAAARRVLLVELEAMATAECPPKLEIVTPVVEPLAEPAWVEEDSAAEQPVAEQPVAKSTAGGLTVRLYEDAGRSAREAAQQAAISARRAAEGPADSLAEDERRMLDEEIAYRQSPMEDLERTSVAIPGNLLEFPRQLVAARKARPRYAEGPLREDADAPDSQLRIFEVEAVQTEVAVESAAPEWSSIWLDALAKATPEETAEEAQYALAQRPETAAISRRVMAAMVDGSLIGLAYVMCATMFVYETEALPGLVLAGIASALLVGCLYLMYQMLFFTLGEATPGMRYARIGLCTFADENPKRAALRRRVFAELLAACPLGLGLLWACLDDDRLGWHDRMSGMYPREY